MEEACWKAVVCRVRDFDIARRPACFPSQPPTDALSWRPPVPVTQMPISTASWIAPCLPKLAEGIGAALKSVALRCAPHSGAGTAGLSRLAACRTLCCRQAPACGSHFYANSSEAVAFALSLIASSSSVDLPALHAVVAVCGQSGIHVRISLLHCSVGGSSSSARRTASQ
jgi:hypothetical protein